MQTRERFLKKIILMCLLVLLCLGCEKKWSKEIQAIHMMGCMKQKYSQTEEYCECTLEKFMEKYSEKEYESLPIDVFQREAWEIAKICKSLTK